MTNAKYQQLEYQLKFLTPAFLGNAEQSGQWRTPPIKALLRQWWRVAVAENMNYDVNAIRKREGELFGVAADGGESRKSLVRIRLSRWEEGKLKSWSSKGNAYHPEVGEAGRNVDASLYLGFGPLEYKRDTRATGIKNNAAIQHGEEATLRLAFPAAYARELETTLWLMERYGTLGGRSRNGWGSFSLTSANEVTPVLSGALPVSDWQAALQTDWPHAIGKDDKPLIWQTGACNDWQAVMKQLAEVKIGLRTQFLFRTGRNAPAPESRHWLSYPVTNHSVKNWGNNSRLSNSLRFKVRQDKDGRLRGVIFHVPCKPPRQFGSDAATLQTVWQQVHRYLDNSDAVTRIAE